MGRRSGGVVADDLGSQINEYSLVASGTRPARGDRAYNMGCSYWYAVHLAIILFRHNNNIINYLLTKRGRGDTVTGIVTVVS